MSELNLIDFYKKFSTEQACRDYLEHARWDDSVICPHCGAIDKAYKYKSGRLFKCGECRQQFTVRVGTIFEDSKVALQKWFLAVFLITSLKKGVSSVQLSKYIGVTQKTAWFMLQRIRYALESDTSSGNKFMGIVEADETYVGGRRPMHQVRDNKTPVVGIAEKRGQVLTKVLDRKASDSNVMPFLIKHIEPLSVLHTDKTLIYRNASKDGFKHRSVDHGVGHYVENGIHTNNIEGFWSHLKRGINGIYIHVSPQHLQKYCNEYEYRFNTRDLNDFERFEHWFSLIGCKLTYNKLIGVNNG